MRILITGFFGVNNLGDDIMLEVFCNRILQENPALDITVLLLYGEELNIKLPKSIKILKINKFKRGKTILMDLWLSRRYDALFWIGGTCLTENAGDGIYRYMETFKRRNKKFGYIGIGIGTIISQQKISQYKKILDLADIATFRDEKSYQTAVSLSENDNLYLCEDLVYLYPETCNDDQFDNNSNLIISWRTIEQYYNADIERKSIECLCDYVVKHQKRFNQIEILILGNQIDYHTNEAIYNKLNSAINSCSVTFIENSTLDEKIQKIKNAKLFISGRLHGIFIAELNNINTVAIGYDNKIERFLDSISKKEDLIYPDEMTVGKLEGIINNQNNISSDLILKKLLLSEQNLTHFIRSIN